MYVYTYIYSPSPQPPPLSLFLSLRREYGGERRYILRRIQSVQVFPIHNPFGSLSRVSLYPVCFSIGYWVVTGSFFRIV